MKAQTPQEAANEQTIRKLYSLAIATTKDTPGFVAVFGNGGYFYDVGAGKKYYGQDIGVTVDNYATAFPDMHRDLISLYAADDVVVVELTLNGTHKSDSIWTARSGWPPRERRGGLIVLRVTNTAEARAIAEDDPMIRGGYESYELATWPIADRQNSYRPSLRGVMTK